MRKKVLPPECEAAALLQEQTEMANELYQAQGFGTLDELEEQELTELSQSKSLMTRRILVQLSIIAKS
eukprot:2913538-Amphidinium_carterae.2